MCRTTAIALVSVGLLATAQAQPAVPLEIVLDRLGAYLTTYEPELSSLVANERFTQQTTFKFAPRLSRIIESEVAFISLPGGAGWVGFRHVMKVGGKAVKDQRPALGALLARGDAGRAQAHALLEESARYNMGAARTINLPNLPLEFVHPRNRARFMPSVFGKDRIRGTDTVVVLLEETSRPTLIQRPEGGDIMSRVMAWVEPTTGRLLRAEVKSRDARLGASKFESRVWVDFAMHSELKMLVPRELQEDFYVDNGVGDGRATYDNFRRFTTSARIVPPSLDR